MRLRALFTLSALSLALVAIPIVLASPRFAEVRKAPLSVSSYKKLFANRNARTILTPFAASYTWNQTGTASYTTSTNWTPTRTTPASDDILVFNNGATTTVTNVPPGFTIGAISVGGGTNVTLEASPTATLTLSGGLNCLDIAAGSSLNIDTATALTLNIASGSTARINGSMTFSGGGHKLTGNAANAISFNGGSTFTAGTGFTGSAFGSTSNSAIFSSGSTYVQVAGGTPFPASVFQTGSLFKVTGVDQSPSFSGNTYANLEFAGTGTSSMTGASAVSIDKLTITSGTVNIGMTGAPGHAINGNIIVGFGATLNFNPASAGTFNLNGTSAQAVSNSGTFTTSANQTFDVSNSAGVTLKNPLTFAGPIIVEASGILATEATLTNNGTLNLNGGTFQLNDGGFASGNDFVYSSGTLLFNTFGNYNTTPTPVFWPSTNGPTNVNVAGSGGITMGTARTVNGVFQYAAGVSGANNLTLNGTVQVNTGGFTSGSPTYGSSALLKYNTGGNYGRNGEWLPNVTSGAGYPANVQLSNNTKLDLPNTSTGTFTLNGNLTIDSGSTMTLSGVSTTANLAVKGNFANSGTYTPGSQTLTFSGGSAQTWSDSNSQNFGAVIINNSATGVTLNSNISVSTLTDAAGALNLNGFTLANSGTLSVGSTLKGTGTVSGAVSVGSGGTIAPGNSPGIINSSSVSFASGSNFNVEIGGTTAGSGYDQLNVTGTVTLGNATLNLSQFGGFTPAAGQTFTIINNDGNDAISGTFNSLTKGATISNFIGSGFTAKISYIGGDGNDVVLTVVGCPSTFIVNSSADDADANPGDQICETAPGNGICTLRAAIQEANLSCLSSVAINFDSNVFVPPSTYGIMLNSALPALHQNITIVGPGAKTVSIDGQGSQIFHIDPGFITSISGLTITNGHTTGSGGGIFNGGTLTSSDLVVSNNSANGAAGGIFNDGTLTLTNCTVSNNQASKAGGIQNTGTGTLTVDGCTVDSNTSTTGGGGIQNSGQLKLVNTVVSNNNANRRGGGILNDTTDGGGPGLASITNSTIIKNIADADNNNATSTCLGQPCTGGGLYNNALAGNVTLVNTIVAGNILGSQAADDIQGQNVNGSSLNNLIGTGGSGGLTDGVNGNQVGVADPKLAADGTPGPGSPAIDKGNDCILTDTCGTNLGFNVTTDRNGQTRPQGPHVDIGAFEVGTFVVNTTADHDDGACEALSSGHDCTLREAILAANTNPNSMIVFGIPGNDSGCDVNGICTISPTVDLPQIVAPVFIDGYSQAGAHPNTKHLNEGDDAVLTIVVNGANDPSASSRGLDLETGSDVSTIRGLVINHWNGAGIFIQDSSSNTISGNFIGTDAAGTSSGGGTGAGVLITTGCNPEAADNLIGGDLPEARNIISGNGAAGIDIGAINGTCVVFNTLEGNYIGTDRTGKLAVPNATHGVVVENGSEFNVIGCEVLDGDNVISGNTDAGVFITQTDSCLLEGNFIGTDCTGTAALGNKRGVVMSNSLANQIGLPGFASVISGNLLNGVEMLNPSTDSCDQNFVQGNLIGTDLTGTVAIGNGQSGVLINGSGCNLIGGGNDGEGNLISGNGDEGIALLGTSFNVVQGNFIGTDINGTVALGNVGHGVEVYINPPVNSTDNIIGGSQIIVGNRARIIAERARRAGTRKSTGAQTATNQLTARGKFSASIANRLAAITSAKDLALMVNRQRTAGAANRRGFAAQPQTARLRVSTARRQDSGQPSLQNGSTSNLISGNGGDGVRVSSNGDFNNLISQNSITANGGLGINLGTDGVTPNNSLDHATGPNHYQNFPVITSADPNTQNITYTFDTTGGTGPFVIEFFVNDVCDGTNGEGKTFIGSTNLESSGTFNFTAQTPFAAGQIITATATDNNNNTSEFSPCFCTATPATPTASNGGPYCEGATIQLSTPAVAGATYSWTGPNGFSSNQPNPTRPNATTADAGPYSVTVAVNGCPSSPGSTSVVVNPIPAAPTASNTGPYAQGQTIQLSANTVAGGTYSWTGPNGFTSSLQNPTRTNATTADAGTYSVTVTVNGCTSPAGSTNVNVTACPTSFTVDDFTDGGDASPGDGVCGNSNQQCTLRAAIEEANALSICSGTIDINFAIGSSTIQPASQFIVDHKVNIIGPTSNSVTINGGNLTRLFTINGGRSVSISNLTLTKGNGSGGDGGAILNNGTLTLNAITLSGNNAVNGGAISNTGTLSIINTTISGNAANNNGGGLFNGPNPATLTNVTVAYNRADNDNNTTGTGGGIFSSPGTVLIHNTIVTDNYVGASPSTTADNVGGSLNATSSYNLIGAGAGGLTNGTNNNQVGVATAWLGALMNNGGPTLTHGLLYNSPAIDVGDDCVFTNTCSPSLGSALTVDQRGLSRQANGDLTVGTHVDIGAYERQTTETRNVNNGGPVTVDLNDVRVTFPCTPAGICNKAQPEGTNGAPQKVSPAVSAPTLSLTDVDPATQPAPPPGFVLGNNTTPPLPTFDVTPSALTFDPPARVCFYLPSINDSVFFAGITLLHNNGSSLDLLANQTRDFPNHLVCGDTNSFSVFVGGHSAAPTAANGTVSGQILDHDGIPVEGAAVRMTGSQNRLTITDTAGNYHFDDVETNGFYVITPSRANFAFSPSQKSFSQLGAHTEAIFTGAATGGGANPLDTTEYFVRQQYLDFLGREPDESGFNFWVNNLESCGSDSACREVKRVDTSAAFFLSIECQQTGYLVYRTYESAYGNPPAVPVPLTLNEFRPDTREISNGVVVLESGWQQTLENNKRAFMSDFVQRARFRNAYSASMTPAEFVSKLFANAHVDLTDSDYAASIAEFAGAADTSDVAARARVLRRVAENSTLTRTQFNQAFVLMEYFGYLQRDPNSGQDTDFSGYNFWLTKLNQFNGNFEAAEMVKAFLSAAEYRARFPR